MKRDEVTSWLDGGPPAQGTFRGQRLGLPEAGPGSMAGLGRRSLALVIDWWASWLVAYLIWGAQPWGTLGVFAFQNLVLLATVGATFGHRLVGLGVVRTGVAHDLPAPQDVSAAAGRPGVPDQTSRRGHPDGPDGAGAPARPVAGIGILPSAIRTVLLCLVLPAVVWDGDGRGLHDRAAGTAIVRR